MVCPICGGKMRITFQDKLHGGLEERICDNCGCEMVNGNFVEDVPSEFRGQYGEISCDLNIQFIKDGEILSEKMYDKNSRIFDRIRRLLLGYVD